MTDTSTTRIFVIDDEVELTEFYKNILSDQYRISAFNSPGDFLKALDLSLPDLVISDLKMPEMTGVEMLRKAQSQGYKFPFIIVSGYLDRNVRAEAAGLGACHLLEKPVDYDLLISSIQNLLKRKA